MRRRLIGQPVPEETSDTETWRKPKRGRAVGVGRVGLVVFFFFLNVWLQLVLFLFAVVFCLIIFVFRVKVVFCCFCCFLVRGWCCF